MVAVKKRWKQSATAIFINYAKIHYMLCVVIKKSRSFRNIIYDKWWAYSKGGHPSLLVYRANTKTRSIKIQSDLSRNYKNYLLWSTDFWRSKCKETNRQWSRKYPQLFWLATSKSEQYKNGWKPTPGVTFFKIQEKLL